MYTDLATATIKLNPETDIDSTSDPILTDHKTSFTIRVSQDNILLSKPALITWPRKEGENRGNYPYVCVKITYLQYLF